MATKSEFRDFVRRQRKHAADDGADIDWRLRRDKWLAQIEALYELVKGFLDEYAMEGAVHYRFEEIEINEDRIGVYEAARMLIQIGSTIVSLTPVGTIIFDAHGRVDLDGPAGKVRLVLVEASATDRRMDVRILKPGEAAPTESIGRADQLVWKIATPPPQLELIELTAERFYDAVLEVANG